MQVVNHFLPNASRLTPKRLFGYQKLILYPTFRTILYKTKSYNLRSALVSLKNKLIIKILRLWYGMWVYVIYFQICEIKFYHSLIKTISF